MKSLSATVDTRKKSHKQCRQELRGSPPSQNPHKGDEQMFIKTSAKLSLLDFFVSLSQMRFPSALTSATELRGPVSKPQEPQDHKEFDPHSFRSCVRIAERIRLSYSNLTRDHFIFLFFSKTIDESRTSFDESSSQCFL